MSKEPKMKPIVIVGAGGMGRDTQWLIERINEEEPTYEILGYIDDGIQQGSIIDGYPILGGMKYLEEYDKEQKLAVAFAIGNAKVREKLVLKCLPNPNLWYPNLIDPSVITSQRVHLGQGNIICTSVIMTTNIEIGNFNLICNRSIVGHDDEIGDYNTLYPGVLLPAPMIIQGLHITDEVIMGAGSTVIEDINEAGTYVGVPVRRVNDEE